MTFPVWESGNEETYWKVVKRCLVEILHLEEAEANSKVADFRMGMALEKLRQPEIVYHDEPINVAIDLAGKHLELSDEAAKKYERILKEVA